MSAPEAGNILIHTWKEHSNRPLCPPVGCDPVKDELWRSTEMELRSEYNQGLIVKSRRLAGTCAGGSAQHLLKAGPVTSACSGTCQGLNTSQGTSWVLVIPDTSQSLSIAESCLVLWHRRHVLFFPCSQKLQANPQLQTSCSLSALLFQRECSRDMYPFWIWLSHKLKRDDICSTWSTDSCNPLTQWTPFLTPG